MSASKTDVSVQVPDVLDLSSLRGHGLVTGEEELPAGDSPPGKVFFQVISVMV